MRSISIAYSKETVTLQFLLLLSLLSWLSLLSLLSFLSFLPGLSWLSWLSWLSLLLQLPLLLLRWPLHPLPRQWSDDLRANVPQGTQLSFARFHSLVHLQHSHLARAPPRRRNLLTRPSRLGASKPREWQTFAAVRLAAFDQRCEFPGALPSSRSLRSTRLRGRPVIFIHPYAERARGHTASLPCCSGSAVSRAAVAYTELAA